MSNDKEMNEYDVYLYLISKVQAKEKELDDLRKEAQEALELKAGCDKIIAATEAMRAEQEKEEYIKKNLYTITDIAKSYGYKATELNKILATLGIQYKVKGNSFDYWRIAKKYEECDYVRYVGNLMKWTPKGKAFIDETLAKNK